MIDKKRFLEIAAVCLMTSLALLFTGVLFDFKYLVIGAGWTAFGELILFFVMWITILITEKDNKPKDAFEEKQEKVEVMKAPQMKEYKIEYFNPEGFIYLIRNGKGEIVMRDKIYITTYVMGDGNIYKSSTYGKPNLINYVCPNCGAYPMKYYKEDMGECYGYNTVSICEICGSRFDEGDQHLKPSPIEDEELLDVIEVVVNQGKEK